MRTDALVAAGSPNPGFRGIASRSPIRRLIAALNLCPFILTNASVESPSGVAGSKVKQAPKEKNG